MPLTHEFENTVEDLLALNWHCAETLYRSRLRAMQYGPAIVAALFLVPLWIKSNDVWLVVAVGSAIVVWPMGFSISFRRRVKVAVERMLRSASTASVLCRHQLVLAEEGLIEKTAVSENKTAWSAIGPVEQSSAHVFLFVAPGVAHCIPKASFGSPEAMREFLAEVERLRTGRAVAKAATT